MQQQTITLPDGFAINARVWGPEDGIPVIGLHGWMDNAATLDELAPLLSELRLVSIDLPGHGFSDHLSHHTDYSVLNIPPYIMAVADALRWDKFSMIGHSMGGVGAQLLAATYPERVEQLVLLDIFGIFSLPDDTIVDQLRGFYKQYFRAEPPSRVYPDLDIAAKVRMSNGDLSFSSALTLAKGGMHDTEDGYRWAFDPAIRKKSALRITYQQKIAIYQHIEAPVCVIVADDGILTRLGHKESDFDYVKNCTVHHVPGGHHVHLDDAQSVAASLRQFLSLPT